MTAPHVIEPPPSDSTLNQRIAEILASTATTLLAAKAIERLLRPFGIGVEAIVGALKIANGRGTAHRQRPKFKTNGLPNTGAGADVMRAAANEELYYRAAYVVAAAHRIQRGLKATTPIRTVLADESTNYRRHEQARTQRRAAAERTARAAQIFGDVLGWYLNPALNNEAECIAASGNNFHADTMPIIGWPGAVHMFCGCYASVPHENAGWVNDAVALHVTHAGARVLKLRRKAS